MATKKSKVAATSSTLVIDVGGGTTDLSMIRIDGSSSFFASIVARSRYSRSILWILRRISTSFFALSSMTENEAAFFGRFFA